MSIPLFGGKPKSTGADAGKKSPWIKDTTTKDFVKDVVEASLKVPVLVDFWAPWCGPCKQLTPILEKVVEAAKGKILLVKMNIDEHPQIAGQLGVQSIPAVFAFVGGRGVDGFMGALPESQVKQFVARLIGDGGDAGDDPAATLEAAEAALTTGDIGQAASLFAALLEQDPENLAALAGLIRAYVKAGSLEQAEKLLAMLPTDKQANSAIVSAKAALDLARKSSAMKGEVGRLEAAVAKNASDFQARFDLALARNASGDKDGAARELLEIMRRNRSWNEDAARKQLLEFFDAWGPKDQHTLDGRKQLSSLLFS